MGKLVILLVCCFLAGEATFSFLQQRKAELSIDPAPGWNADHHLSDYLPDLKGSYADSVIYENVGENPGGTVFIMAGTHPNESGTFEVIRYLLEKGQVEQGRLIVLPVANRSASSATAPGYGYPMSNPLLVGARLTNPLEQWPDPPIYREPAGNTPLSTEEARNLNRCYPGRRNGSTTERVAYAITRLLEQEQVDWAFDLHEASVTYPTNQTYIVSEKDEDLAFLASLSLSDTGEDMHVEVAPASLRGFSYNEWSRIENVHAFLLEVPTPEIDRVPGVMTTKMIVSGQDPFLQKMAEKGYGWGYGMSLAERTKLELDALMMVLEIGGAMDSTKAVSIHFPLFDN